MKIVKQIQDYDEQHRLLGSNNFLVITSKIRNVDSAKTSHSGDKLHKFTCKFLIIKYKDSSEKLILENRRFHFVKNKYFLIKPDEIEILEEYKKSECSKCFKTN